MKKYKLLTVSVFIPIGIIIVFMYWYQWGTRILSPSDVNDYMGVIEAQTQKPGAKHDLHVLRKFLSEDDGKPFYTVNLYKFHAVAEYPEASGFSGTGEQAYDRFSSVMISLMVKRGSHPVYGSHWVDQANSDWDRIVIVRYRSRRDLIDLFATDDFAEASLHKWASLREHERMLVQALHIPNGITIIAMITIFIGIAINLIGRFVSRERPT
ncbi:MAG: hypothetical protein V7754_18945 [Halioglobus sp.]